MAMPPPPPPEEAPPPPPEEPEPKRQKVDEFPLIPEDTFLAQHPVCVSVLSIVLLNSLIVNHVLFFGVGAILLPTSLMMLELPVKA